MTRLLKANSAEARIRPIPAGGTALPAAFAIEDPTAALRMRIAELEAGLAMAAAELPGELEKAREEGRRQGLEERDASAAERLDLLEQSLAAGLGSLSHRLEASGAFAIEIARSVVERMTGDKEWRSEWIRTAIARRLSTLDAASLVSVRVSPEDFEASDLAHLAARSRVAVEVDPSLSSGECLLSLAMGEIDLGIAAQWREAARLLDRLADGQC